MCNEERKCVLVTTRTRCYRVLFLCNIICICFFWLCPITIKAMNYSEDDCILISEEQNKVIEMKSSSIKWVMKSVKNKLYKRAYDTRAKKWITDWQLIQ